MAQVIANGIGTARGRNGVNYYRRVDGRTLVCILPGPSAARKAAAKENINCAFMAIASLFMKVHAKAIKAAFNKVKYGSQRNYFFKVNNAGLREAWGELAQRLANGGSKVTIEEIELALQSWCTAFPNSVYRVHRDGFQDVYLTGAWNDNVAMVPLMNQPEIVSATGNYVQQGEAVRFYGVYLQGKGLHYMVTPYVEGVAQATQEVVITAYTDTPYITLEHLNEVVGLEYEKYEIVRVTYNNNVLWPISSLTTYRVTASVNGGNGSVTPTSTLVEAGASVTLTATPDSGYRVNQWSTGATTNQITITPTADIAVSVSFVATTSGGGAGGGDDMG